MSATAPVEADKPNGPRSRKGADSRARLVEAAKAVFSEDGFVDARITDIAERAGLSHGSFYHYFDSKESVLREVAEALDDRLNAPLGDEIFHSSPHLGPRQRIREGNRRFLQSYKKEAPLISVVEHASRLDEQLHAARFNHQQHYGKELSASIRQLQRSGLVDPKLNPMLAAQAVGAMVTRFADLWLTQKVIECSFETAVDQLTRLVANALQLPEEDTPATPDRQRKP